MKTKLTQLLEVRKLISLIVIVLFFILSVTKVLEVNFIQTVIISVISFYFGKSTALDMPKEVKRNEED